jgi:hypothetical protein
MEVRHAKMPEMGHVMTPVSQSTTGLTLNVQLSVNGQSGVER